MKYLVSILFLISLCTCENTDSDLSKDRELLFGKWINMEDDSWQINFQEDLLIDSNIGLSADTSKYSLTVDSCDSSYSIEKVVFIKCWSIEPLCYEVVCLTDGLLTFRESVTGYLHEFRKMEVK